MVVAASCGSGGPTVPPAGTPADAIARAEWTRSANAGPLLDALASGNPDERARAAVAMGRVQDPGYAEALARAARTPESDRNVRSAALFALGQLGLGKGARANPTALAACRSALDDDDDEIVARAVQCLGKQADPADGAAFEKALAHTSETVRVEAADAWMRSRFAPVWREETDAPPEMDGRAVRALAERLVDDPGVAVRRAAAHALARYGEPAAAGLLSRGLEDDDAIVRRFTARSIGRSGDATAASAVAEAQNDPDPGVRIEAVSALAALERGDLLEPGLLEDDHAHVRAAFAAALAGPAIEATRREAWIARLAEDPSPTVVGAAVTTRAALAGPRAIEDLARTLEHPSFVARAAAATAATWLGDRGGEILLRAIADPDPRVRAAAIASAEHVAAGEAVRARIRAAVRDDDLGIRAAALGHVDGGVFDDPVATLREAYGASSGVRWVEIRETIATALAAIDSSDARAFLRETIAADEAPSVRSIARRELGLDEPDTPAPTSVLWRFPPEEASGVERVTVETSRGALRIRLYPREAPLHVANFVGLAREGFYDGLPWHRVVRNFVIQGGDPERNGWGGPGYTIPDEIGTRRFERGTVGMPKAGKDTGGCQLFVTHLPTPHLDGNYTVFGQVVEGLDVLDRIEIGDTITRVTLD